MDWFQGRIFFLDSGRGETLWRVSKRHRNWGCVRTWYKQKIQLKIIQVLNLYVYRTSSRSNLLSSYACTSCHLNIFWAHHFAAPLCGHCRKLIKTFFSRRAKRLMDNSIQNALMSLSKWISSSLQEKRIASSRLLVPFPILVSCSRWRSFVNSRRRACEKRKFPGKVL